VATRDYQGAFFPSDKKGECLHCTHLGRITESFLDKMGRRNYTAWCLKHKAWNSVAHAGCAYFRREPGSDDDVGEPA